MPPRRAVIRRYAHEPVYATFGLGVAVCILAFNLNGRSFDSGGIACLILDRIDLEATLFRPAGVHAEQHFGPVLAFSAPCPCVDFDEGIERIGFARQERRNLVLVRTVGERRKCGHTFVGQGLIAFHFGKLDQFDCTNLVGIDFPNSCNGRIETAPFAHHLFGLFGIVPQSRVFNARVQFVEAAQSAVPIERHFDKV